jgi:hypothetical protein
MSAHYVTSIDGLRVRLPQQCRCGSDELRIERALDLSSVPVTCTRCFRTCGWITAAQARAIERIVACFERPTTPVEVRDKWTIPIPDETRASSGES